MRRGYWRTLTRQLRDKVAVGENAFIVSDDIITIARVEADADADLDRSQDVLLAYDSNGRQLVLDIANSAVLLIQNDQEKRVLAEDLITFINALCAQIHSQSGFVLGDAIGGAIDFPRPRRSIFDD